MILPLHDQIRARVRAILAEAYDLHDDTFTIAIESPPNRSLGDLGTRDGLLGGINAVIVGNYLTTLGRPATLDDIRRIVAPPVR